MSELGERLQSALGGGYRVEKELGGGGMSRVFLAEETRLGRQVVIKVLPPEMGAGVNVERFEREIQLAAKLQHPHIVPLLSAGSQGDILWYVMPFIEGESLRAKLAREGELPIAEALRILRDVLDALAYAHDHGIVHRDIKPGNVLLTRKHAVVTDFGVAKAVSESTGGTSLTSAGVALGTPAYMSPEQAAGNLQVDHRADLYGVGTLAYEMLTGRPPFTGANVQAVLSAHLIEAPEPVTMHRETVSAALDQLILRCLAKRAADRPQGAEEVLSQLDGMLTPTGGTTPTETAPVEISSGTRTALKRTDPVRVAALFGVAAAVVLALVYGLMHWLGLPDWAFLGAVILLAIGLPIILVTAHHERERVRVRPAYAAAVEGRVGLRRWFTWRKALVGGGLAFAGLAVMVGGYMGMRALGIGPVGTLVAAGVLDERDPLLVADFANRTDDSGLGQSVTEALRIDLAQSPIVRVLDGVTITEALARMQRAPDEGLDSALAMELAEREGVKAVVTGEIGRLGRGYVLSARVVSIPDRVTRVAVRETADSDGAIIASVDRLSKTLRARIGESLKSIRQARPLEAVSTNSLEALRVFSEAERAAGRLDYAAALALLQEAIALDSTFAMAYRKLGVVLTNAGASRAEINAAARKGFELRNRLPAKERYLTEAYYFSTVEPDRERVMSAYRSVLQLDPDDHVALNNLALELNDRRRFTEAETLALRAVMVDDHVPHYDNVLHAQVAQGKFTAADSTLARFARRVPESPNVVLWQGDLARIRGEYELATARYDSARRVAASPIRRGTALYRLAGMALLRGQVTQAAGYLRQRMVVDEERRLGGAYIERAVELAQMELRWRQSTGTALAVVATALRRHPLPSIPAPDRPYLQLAAFYAEAGRIDTARDLVTEWEREVPEALRRDDPARYLAAGAIAMAEGRLEDAILAYRAHYEAPHDCRLCGVFELGQALDRAELLDSAMVVYQEAARGWTLWFWVWDTGNISLAHERLGELYERLGERENAVQHYGKFVELWQDADPELQPVVREVRERIARLVRER